MKSKEEITSCKAFDTEFGPWHPGIESQLPRRLMPLATLFRPENVISGVERGIELRGLTGLELEELVAFRPQRLVLHELLVRVTANLSVPDGPRLEDLGITFRNMTSTIFTNHIEPHLPEIEEAYSSLRAEFYTLIKSELAGVYAARASSAALDAAETRVQQMLTDWEARARADESALRRAAFRAVLRVVTAVRVRHGHLWGESALLAEIATDMACNDYGSIAIGRLIEPYFAEAVQRERYTRLPAQRQPVVMNIKGASASGKSSMRPLQKKLAAEIGVRWSDFALISPDIWRKQLLDYGALGENFKYAGTFAGQELHIIDQKLDRYMADKAKRGEMSHLLIDRFRFDSFAPESDEAGSNLLTRFGHIVYLFFMITPPHSTVERSWKRGLDVGRYKAVDDLLAHNVEAYTGMPELFFIWALRGDKTVHYEFLDNSVSAGERPRTAAFGLNGELNVLDVKCLLDIERYGKIDVHATNPQQVYRDGEALAAAKNTRFLVQCARRLPALNFADRDTGRVYARIESGALAWTDTEILNGALQNPETRAGLLAVAPNAMDTRLHRSGEPRTVERRHTLGR
jgi:hypothetical protein